MNLYYTVNKNIAIAKHMNSGIFNLISTQFGGVFKAASFILKKIFKINTFDIDLISKRGNYNLITEATFLIKTPVGIFNLILEREKFRLFNNEVSLQFALQSFYPQDELALVECIIIFKNRIFVERFSNHNMELEIHFKDTGKVFYLSLPMECPFILEQEYMCLFNKSMDIKDVIKFYRRDFIKYQSTFDRSECRTVISVWQKMSDFEDYSKKGIKLDEVSLLNGLVCSYQLGRINQESDINPVVVVLKDGVYTITGFNSENNANVDVNQAILFLEKKKQELK